MNILIISLPRTGSTELGKDISFKHKLKYECEPFNGGKRFFGDYDLNNVVLKTIVFHLPNYIEESNRISWLIELSQNFNEVILLSRRNLVACAESWAYLMHNEKQKRFKADEPYLWEKTPNFNFGMYQFIKKCNSELVYISEKLNIPITYYEDIYNENDSNRLRKGDVFNYSKNII
jgi:hypothetical protein